MARHIFLLIFSVNLCFSQSLTQLKPVDAGYKKDFFNKIDEEAIKTVPSLGSIMVWKNNGIVHESYFNETTDQTQFQMKSVTKSVMSALAGIAMDKGLLPNLQTPVLKVLSEYDVDITKNKNVWYKELLSEKDSIKRTLTLENLLTMQTGFVWDDSNILSSRVMQTSSDPVRYMLELPYEDLPGTKFKYCTGASHVMSAVITRCVGTDLKTFADSTLFEPLGIDIEHWTCDPSGIIAGGVELSMRSRDMMKFGLLFLNEGKYNDQQIISKSWIKESTSEQAIVNEWDVLPGANGYGYQWWRRVSNGHQVFVASGYGGQLICVIPDLKMVVTTTCLVNEKNRGRSEIKRLHLIIDKIVKESIN